MFPTEIRTDRLRLERATRESVSPLELYEHGREGADGIEDVTRHVPFSPYRTSKEPFDFLADCERRWEDGESAEYAVRLPDGEFVGMAGLDCHWDRGVAEPGVWLRKRFWGRGYSGERARALMRLAFERLDFDLVAVGVAADNEKSRRAVEKYVEAAGGRFEGVVRRGLALDGDDVRDEARYSVSQAEWRESGGADDSVRFGASPP